MLVSCAGLPVTGDMPHGTTLTPLARVPDGALFVPDPEGRRVALSDDGLALLETATGHRVILSPDDPQAMTWSPDGRHVAAAFRNVRGSEVRIYDTSGTITGTVGIDGNVSALAWRGAHEVLVAAMEVKVFSFGSNFVQALYRWDNGKPPVRMELQNSTLRPKTGLEGQELSRLFTLSLSPFGDAIVYTRLHDPPVYSPNIHYVLRNLATGSEKNVATASLNSGGVKFAGGDDRMLYGDGESETVLRDPWRERNLSAFPGPGHSLAASGGGTTLLIDGRLFRDGKLLLAFPADTSGSFNSDGSLLFLRRGRELFLMTGLPSDPPPKLPADIRDRYLTLRQWRSDGLIDPADFTKTVDQLEKP
jgi:hypothetical protein